MAPWLLGTRQRGRDVTHTITPASSVTMHVFLKFFPDSVSGLNYNFSETVDIYVHSNA